MTTKRIVFVIMCIMLFTTAVMTGAVAMRLAPIIQMFTDTPQETQQTKETESTAESTAESTQPSSDPEESSEPTEGHEHKFTILDHTQKATCTTYGYSVYACECGEIEYRDMKQALGHKWSAGVKREASCIEGGGTVYTCGNCGMEDVRNIKPATGHSYGPWKADPQDPYMEIRQCANCDRTESREAEDPSIPTESTGTTDPSESTDPGESIDPSESTDPSESIDPSESTDPSESIDPSESVDPSESGGATVTTDPEEEDTGSGGDVGSGEE